MRIITKILLVYLVQSVCGKVSFKDDRDLVVPQYISYLIRELSEKDCSRNHDVVLIRAVENSKSEIFHDILTETLRENPNNTVFAHESFKRIKPYRAHTASFIIIVSDIHDSVSSKTKALKTFYCNYTFLNNRLSY